MCRKKFTLLCFLSFAVLLLQGQGLINNGAKIIICQGAIIQGGSYTNLYGGADGSIDLDGRLVLQGNWTNDANTENVFINMETTPDGNVELTGASGQSIAGSTPTLFENLVLQNGEKTLNISGAGVKGLTTLDSYFDLNHHRFIIENNATNAIYYVSGCFISENPPATGLGEIEWKTGVTAGNFAVPFGTGTANNDLNLVVTYKNAVAQPSGSLIVATWPTDASNQPLPDAATSLDTYKPEDILDRYWKVDANYIAKPDAAITFSYTLYDDDIIDNPELDAENLKPLVYKTTSSRWFIPSTSEIADPSLKRISVDNIHSEDFFTYWTLTDANGDLIIPNTFSPNSDGINEVFYIENIGNYPGNKVSVYNRWGSKVFSATDYKNDWTGDELPAAAYYYIVELPDGTKKSGDINIIR
ncbi:MAG: gliding motility-associated C-terminal domain-containing protein [Bacteroidota bacterium]